MRAVTSSSAPLIALADVGQRELLQRLFSDVTIPPAVRAEVLTTLP
jgi:predicted nucleic acid-binding protein